ncbi:hypothetical protein R3I93_022177 [Phoxinus phoxinus]|uniref:protein-tyrosine-phosphatase n=1 Tax=Phoxinus phoxinus TaxID=58324 RepID=A0AAN9GRW8_9TELE
MERVYTLVLLCAVSALGIKPNDVKNVSVTDRTETELTFQWDIVEGNTNYTYELMNGSGQIIEITATDRVVTQNVSSLSPGTNYSFTLYTVSNETQSDGFNFWAVTVPSNVVNVVVVNRKETEMTLQWEKVNNHEIYTYELDYKDGEKPIPRTNLVEQKVENLTSGTEYFFTLYTVFKDVKSSGYNFSNVTVPYNVADTPIVVAFNDTDVIFKWNTSNKAYNYSLENSKTSRGYINIIFTQGNEVHISGLNPATNYSFTLYTEFFDVRSTGYNFSHTTSLSRVTEVKITRSLTQLNITWNKLNKNNIYDYILSPNNGTETSFNGSSEGNEITHMYSDLTPGTLYSFTLFTQVNGQRNGYDFKSITTINCMSFTWDVTNSSINAIVNGSTNITAKNSAGNETFPVYKNTVNLTKLYPGDSYTVSLWNYLGSEKLLQCSHNLTLVPNSVLNLSCTHFSGGYGLAVIWDLPNGVVDVVQVDVDRQSFNLSSNTSQRQEVKNLQVAQWYKVTATSFSGDMQSKTETHNCQTDPAGVIAGVLVFFLLVLIICAAVYLWFRYGSAKRNKSSKPPPVVSNVTKKNYKPIPMHKFPEHFRHMSCDENRGFSEEYEDLSSVGIEQSNAAAFLPGNNNKNRFSNVLPYDSSRVHLTVNDEDDSDYINASYMPGYGNASKQYIAAQGPLPSTVNDFWRMVWEKRSQAIVMVTNCTESGRVKCEQYWPLDYSPCLYGNLVVTVKSEDKAQSWTLREFNVKNKSSSETRTVKHFHFTAWPDHGVPFGTEELIKFRGRVRQHIENSYSAGPTVVHCSAGVGRTGTLIALDVLLQQLDREKEVAIAAFVQQMRLCRPLMVQTESQYVFLHQCIMDTLEPKVVALSEPLYENSDMIYVNAIALRKYENGSKI